MTVGRAAERGRQDAEGVRDRIEAKDRMARALLFDIERGKITGDRGHETERAMMDVWQGRRE